MALAMASAMSAGEEDRRAVAPELSEAATAPAWLAYGPPLEALPSFPAAMPGYSAWMPPGSMTTTLMPNC